MRNKLRIWMFGCAIMLVECLWAQETLRTQFVSPFDFPLSLSGNFGELRSNHFHGGIDFKTQGVVGKPIHCVADGYVSRVNVSRSGYGQAIYVTHPNGLTSVYGHVLSFMPEVASVVEEEQYLSGKFEQDLVFEEARFPVQAGQIIALSGNEGFSFGPHLHFEIRETATDELIDPLQFYTDRIADTTPPRATHVAFYPQEEGVVEGKQRLLMVPVANLNTPVKAWGRVGLGIRAFDYMDGTTNNYGVRSIVLYQDDVEIYRSTVSRVLPEENRAINAWTDYQEYVSKNNWIMRSFKLPSTPLRLIETNDQRGIIEIFEERMYRFKYELTDLYGNQTVYRFNIQGTPQFVPLPPVTKYVLQWETANTIQEPGLELTLPKGVLYETVRLDTEVEMDSVFASEIYCIAKSPVPLHKGCRLQIALKRKQGVDDRQYYIATKRGNRLGYVGGKVQGDWIEGQVRELATYTVAIDTVAPRITPIGQAGWKTGNIRFKISDSETGVKDYRVTIDGETHIFAYSLKNATLTCKYPNRLPKGNKHTITVWLQDECLNETIQEYEF